MKYFFVDAESDGLYGKILAVGVVITDEYGVEQSNFAAKLNIASEDIYDEWAKQHVHNILTEHCESFLTFDKEEDLLEAFWNFWLLNKEGCYCVANVMYPVESNLFKRCVEKNIKSRWHLAPYPFLDLSSLLYAKGLDPLTCRQDLIEEINSIQNPLNDARLVAAIWNKYYSTKNSGIY